MSDQTTYNRNEHDAQLDLPLAHNIMSLPLQFRITSRLKGQNKPPLFTSKKGEFYSFRECVEAAIQQGIDLSYADLTDPFDGVDILLSNKEIREINRFRFERLSLAYGIYDGGIFKNSLIQGCDFSGSSLKGCDFSGSYTRHQLEKEHMIGYTTEATGTDFSGCDLSNTNFTNSILKECCFSTLINYTLETRSLCKLHNTVFHHSDLSYARFSFVQMYEPHFKPHREEYMQNTTFEYSDFLHVYEFPYILKDKIRFISCQNVK